jgi:adenosylmethionine-8-amino-7-oxononanoate aminotransferase
VWDVDGRSYIDGSAALWYANLGHGRPEIAAAVAGQLGRLDAYSTFGDFANRPALELAERLSALAPQADSKVFLTSGGGDSIDSAAKIARSFHVQNGQPERVHLISRRHGYHGTHGIGTGIAGIPANAQHFGDVVPDASVVDHDAVSALEAEIERVGPQTVAAFFCEPVIGAGGVYPPREGYLEGVAEVCRRHGILFVADCVIAAFGRLGTWWGIDRWPVQPDLITFAKGVTSGTLPLGGVLVAPDVAAPFFPGAPGAPILRHGATYAGHPTCAAAALAALDLYERDGLVGRGRELEGALLDALAPLADDGRVAEVRGGVGLMAAAELSDAVLAADPGAVGTWQLAVRERGVLVRSLARGLAVSPPLVVTEEEIGEIAAAMADGLSALAAG